MYTTSEYLASCFDPADLLDLTDDENSGSVNTDVVQWAIDKAEDEVTGYLTGVYTLPLSTIPAKLKQVATDIAIYNLYYRRDKFHISESIEKTYDRALQYFAALRKGTLDLFTKEDETTKGVSTGIVIQHQPGRKRLFPDTLVNKMPLIR